jgi:DNA-binding GntR family transcriptional regulator
LRLNRNFELSPRQIVCSVEHQLLPGAKLVEQKLANHFGVSRTLVRQALFQLSQNRLIKLEPARGAFVSAPSQEEAKQVFAVRRMLELEMTRNFAPHITAQQVLALRQHIQQERAALAQEKLSGRTEVLGDFHVYMATLMGNVVLAQVLGDLISRCALITLMYQSSADAQHSVDEHDALVTALAAKDADKAVSLMQAHLDHVQKSVRFEPETSCQDAPMSQG